MESSRICGPSRGAAHAGGGSQGWPVWPGQRQRLLAPLLHPPHFLETRHHVSLAAPLVAKNFCRGVLLLPPAQPAAALRGTASTGDVRVASREFSDLLSKEWMWQQWRVRNPPPRQRMKRSEKRTQTCAADAAADGGVRVNPAATKWKHVAALPLVPAVSMLVLSLNHWRQPTRVDADAACTGTRPRQIGCCRRRHLPPRPRLTR